MRYRPLPAESRIREFIDYDPISGEMIDRLTGFPAGSVCPKGYRFVSFDGTSWRASRIAFKLANGRDPVGEIDHINCNRGDDRASNLREATRAENNRNVRRRKDNKSGYKGVCLEPRTQKWRALISIGGRQRSLGAFKTPKEAHAAYSAAAQLEYGAFARTS